MSKLDPRTHPYTDKFAASHLKDLVDVARYGSAVRQQIVMPVVPVHARAATASGMETQMVWGQEFDVYDMQGGWLWGQEVQEHGTEASTGYVGFVPKMALTPRRVTPTHRVNIMRAPAFAKPDLKSPIRIALPLNARIRVEGKEGDYHRVSDIGFMHKNHVTKLGTKTTDFTTVAENHQGLPYIWGGISPDGVDCSGLVQTSLRACGHDAPRDADLQERALGKSIDITKDLTGLQRGDLVFWQGHVGIMQNAHDLVHANAYHMAVTSEPLKEAVKRIAKAAGPITSVRRLSENLR